MLQQNLIRQKLKRDTSPIQNKNFGQRSKSEKKQLYPKQNINQSVSLNNIKNQEKEFKSYFDNLIQSNSNSVYYNEPIRDPRDPLSSFYENPLRAEPHSSNSININRVGISRINENSNNNINNKNINNSSNINQSQSQKKNIFDRIMNSGSNKIIGLKPKVIYLICNC